MLENEMSAVTRRLEDGDEGEEVIARYKVLQRFIHMWHERRSNYWRQLSREQAIKEMDRNSRFFHAVASVRHKRKKMVHIRSGRSITRSPRLIKAAVRNFFKELYKQKEVPVINFQEELVNKITHQEAAALEVQPSAEEIKQAVWDCGATKAPGPDGYNFNFIKKCWSVVGADFVNCISNFFISGSLPRNANMTWVTLIPKIDDAEEIQDYRPISMIGCIYKVIAKVLANRMRSVMANLVGESQSAFVQGRQILDGALIANEAVHWVKRRKKEAIIMKLDFRKAYDSVRWIFVDQVLEKMGFGRVWRN